jgi:hypothetical protein
MCFVVADSLGFSLDLIDKHSLATVFEIVEKFLCRWF